MLPASTSRVPQANCWPMKCPDPALSSTARDGSGPAITTHRPFGTALFGSVLGLAGLGQAWRSVPPSWHLPSWPGQALLLFASLQWLALLAGYVTHALRHPQAVRAEFAHPVQNGTPALLGVSTLLVAIAALPYSRPVAIWLTALGITWHLAFALWHTGTLWRGGRRMADTMPTLYLPTVAGNFTAAAALGALGHADWGWLFMGAGVLSWLGIESLVLQRLWYAEPTRTTAPAIGIQFAPSVVGATALLLLDPHQTGPVVVMLWGYGLFQLLVGARLSRWLLAERYSAAYWSYTFGIASAAICGVKLANGDFAPARILALPVFVFANLVIAGLCLRALYGLFARARTPVVLAP